MSYGITSSTTSGGSGTALNVSPAGGQWVFGLPASGSTFAALQLSTNNGTSFFPDPVAGDLNVEVFLTQSGTPPTPDAGFQAAATDNGGSLVNDFLVGGTLQLGGGDYVVADWVSGAHAPGSIILGSGLQTVVGTTGDTMVGGSGGQTFVEGLVHPVVIGRLGQVLDATAGTESVVGGTNVYTVFGGAGDTIVGNPGATSTTFGLIIAQTSTGGGQMSIVLPTAGTNRIFSSAGDTITGAASTGGGSNDVFGWRGDIIDLTGDNGNVTVLGAGLVPGFGPAGGPEAITAGSGITYVFGAAGDSITGGAGGFTDIVATSEAVVVGKGGGEVIGSGGNDTITALAGNAFVQVGLGSKDSLDLTGNTNTRNLISGQPNSAIATVTLGGGGGGVSGAASMLITLGTGGTATITGSSVSGAGDTIKGTGAANLSYNPGLASATKIGGGDLIDLTGSTGNATINAFSNFSVQGAVNDTIVAGNGADSVFGGVGDRIGTASTGGAGSHLWLHSTTVAGAAMAFGTNDAAAGSSTSKATVGAAADMTSFFQLGTDSLFYQNETAATNASIVAAATSTTIGGFASSVVTLPDGTSVTLIGVTTTQLATANTFNALFKP